MKENGRHLHLLAGHTACRKETQVFGAGDRLSRKEGVQPSESPTLGQSSQQAVHDITVTALPNGGSLREERFIRACDSESFRI